jgi:ATP-dependent helicase HrpA
MQQQLQRLTPDRFLADTPWAWLEHYPRYLQAIPRRLDKLRNAGLQRDLQNARVLAQFEQNYEERAAALRERNEIDERLEDFRWMLEEFRVSLFAQELGTLRTVSPQRLQRQWDETVARGF